MSEKRRCQKHLEYELVLVSIYAGSVLVELEGQTEPLIILSGLLDKLTTIYENLVRCSVM